MQQDKEEREHLSRVLKETQKAIDEKDTLKLKRLSDQMIHSACVYQHTDLINTAVIIFSLSKIISQDFPQKMKNWRSFEIKIKNLLHTASKNLLENNLQEFAKNMEKIRNIIEGQHSMKVYAKEIVKRACINKASKIYEHGISLDQTAKLLGVNQWELADYIGQKPMHEKENVSLGTKKRAKMAMEFFS